MTKKIEDLITEFNSLSIDAQIDKIKNIRNARTIERPVAAVKRVKKEAKVKSKKFDTFGALIKSMTPEQKAAMIAKLKGAK